MLPQRTMLRSAQRFSANIRSPAVRKPFQRRFASAENSGLHGAEDNAFNRERKAVKDHAAATSGMSPLVWEARKQQDGQRLTCGQISGASFPSSKITELRGLEYTWFGKLKSVLIDV